MKWERNSRAREMARTNQKGSMASRTEESQGGIHSLICSRFLDISVFAVAMANMSVKAGVTSWESVAKAPRNNGG